MVEGVCFEAALQDNMSHFIIINAGGGSAGLLMAASLCTNWTPQLAELALTLMCNVSKLIQCYCAGLLN